MVSGEGLSRSKTKKEGLMCQRWGIHYVHIQLVVKIVHTALAAVHKST